MYFKLLAFILFSLCSTVSRAEQQLSFGVYQSDKATTMLQTFHPVIKALEDPVSEKLGDKVTITMKIFKTYDEGINALASGEVDFVRTGPASFILARRQNPNIQLLAMESKKGEKRFKGVIIVPANSSLKSLSELKGKKFAFGDQNSTIGRYLAQAELIKAGVYGKDLAGFEFLGRHDKVAYSVGLGDFDAGSVKAKTFKKEKEKGTVKSLAQFDNVTKPWTAREGLPADTFDALKSALLEMKDEAALKVLKVSGFLPATNEDYDIVREAMELSEKF